MNAEKNHLVVLEAHPNDVGRGVARIDKNKMHDLGLSSGDVIEIKGKRSTVAKCIPSQLFEEKTKLETNFDLNGNAPKQQMRSAIPADNIRIDGLIRNNAGITIGDEVKIQKIEAVLAEKIIVNPLESIPPIDERYLADALESVPLIKGDNVMVSYFGGRLTFQVMYTEPDSAVIVDQKTIFNILNKPTDRIIKMKSVLAHQRNNNLPLLKKTIENYEKELLTKQEEIKISIRDMLKENYTIKEINKFLNSDMSLELLSIHEKLLNAYRQYVAELESQTSKK